MTITSSQIIEDSPQTDGRRWITEEHTDHLGGKHRINYMAEGDADANAIMSIRVAGIEESLADNEETVAIEQAYNGVDPIMFSPEFTTVKKFFKRLIRDAMKNKDVRIVLVLKPLIDFLEATYTAQQIANYLDVSLSVLSRIKTRVNDLYAIKSVIDTDLGRMEEVE